MHIKKVTIYRCSMHLTDSSSSLLLIGRIIFDSFIFRIMECATNNRILINNFCQSGNLFSHSPS
jgi:hypothetical protein